MKTRGNPGSHELGVDVQHFARLEALDRAIAERVRAGGCPHCGGRLDRADYVRKPRGGEIALAAEAHPIRFSLCCARDGCRRRATPPSLRFLGRKVYTEVVVLLACLFAEDAEGTPLDPPGVPQRTVHRWLTWWRTVFVASALWSDLRARFVPPADEARLPTSLLERLEPQTLLSAARLLAPLTTTSVPDGSHFVRDAM